MQILDLDGELSLSVCTVDEAQLNHSSDNIYRFVTINNTGPVASESLFNLSNLGQLYYFSTFLAGEITKSSPRKLLFCVGHDRKMITECSFLLGSYCILMKGSTAAEMISAFNEISSRFLGSQEQPQMSFSEGSTILDGWRALHQAKMNGWVDFEKEEVDIECIDMQEYQHYDNPLNGILHVIIPSRLIAFQAPVNLERLSSEYGQGHYLDVDGRRYFGPGYFADILGGDFGVQVVVRCETETVEPGVDWLEGAANDDDACADVGGYDHSAFEERGMAVEILAVQRVDGATPNSLLRHVDRFLTLARLAPGAVAIHGGDDVGLGSGGELLVSSLLIKRYGFDARSALAWVRLTHPPATPPLLSFSLVPLATQPIACGRQRRSAARRFSAPAILASPELAAFGRARGSGRGDALLDRCKSVPEEGGDLPLCGLRDGAARPVAEPDVFDALLALNIHA